MHQHTVQTPYMVGEVHFYSAELNGELVLFDTGPPTPEGEADRAVSGLSEDFGDTLHAGFYREPGSAQGFPGEDRTV